MPGILANSPADVIAQLLIEMGLVTDPTLVPLQAWPVYVDVEPTTPDSCVTVKDTEGKDDGRTMTDGERHQHHGFQVRVRSAAPPIGFVKANAIAVALDQQVNQALVTLGSHTFIVYEITRTGDVLPIGKDTPNSKRSVFTVNCVSPIRQVS
jgi:hypothetical protein